MTPYRHSIETSKYVVLMLIEALVGLGIAEIFEPPRIIPELWLLFVLGFVLVSNKNEIDKMYRIIYKSR